MTQVIWVDLKSMLTDLGPVQTPPRCLTQVMRRPKSPHPDPRRITASPDGTRCAVPLVRFCVVAFARSRVNARRRQRGRALHRSQRRWTAKARCQVSCTQLARHTLATVTFSAPGTRAPVSQFQRREAAPRAHSPSRVESRSHRHMSTATHAAHSGSSTPLLVHLPSRASSAHFAL